MLYRVIEDLRSWGVAIVYISHRLHGRPFTRDYFNVLRDGRVVGEGVRGSVDRAWIVERASGPRECPVHHPASWEQSADVALRVENPRCGDPDDLP